MCGLLLRSLAGDGLFSVGASARRLLKKPAPPQHPHAAAAAAAASALSLSRRRRRTPGRRRGGGAAAQWRRKESGGKAAARPLGGAVGARKLLVRSLVGRDRCCARGVAALPSATPPRWLATHRRGGARFLRVCSAMARKRTNEE